MQLPIPFINVKRAREKAPAWATRRNQARNVAAELAMHDASNANLVEDLDNPAPTVQAFLLPSSVLVCAECRRRHSGEVITVYVENTEVCASCERTLADIGGGQ
jgi:hypothetical protein